MRGLMQLYELKHVEDQRILFCLLMGAAMCDPSNYSEAGVCFKPSTLVFSPSRIYLQRELSLLHFESLLCGRDSFLNYV